MKTQPAERYLSLADCAHVLGLPLDDLRAGRAVLHRLGFPQPVSAALSRPKWREQQVRDWMAAFWERPAKYLRDADRDAHCHPEQALMMNMASRP